MLLLLITVSVIFLIIYSFLIVKFSIGPSESSKKSTNEDLQIGISIVVAAKNEEKNIQKLISAIKHINYEQENYEVIIVDDHSIDETFQFAKELTADITNVNIVRLDDGSTGGKRAALSYGISLASFEHILITDADCVPEKDWLLHLANFFRGNVDFIIGLAPFNQTKQLVNKISCFENLRSTFLSISVANAGMPYTASARNLGFKKKSFIEIAGYKNTTDTLSGDDDLLLREAVKNKLRVTTLTSHGSFVYSETKKTFKEYFFQRARHTQSSLHYLLKPKIFLAVWHMLNISFLISPLLMFIDSIFIFPCILKLILDTATTLNIQKKLEYKFTIIEIFYLQMLYEIVLIIHFFNAKSGRISWK